ncbi:MAG: hypothetical protein M2R45_00332 [Verrucomicrobia subdivision 3 bacterium]|nr:hypothetical protein [Limisphaerales bacterium]MCS1412909.1 hypothetical protein [Limisphaerales bacterium]
MGIKDARKLVLFQVRHTRYGIQSNLMRLKERPKSMILQLRDQIILVIVTFRTLHR